MNYNLIDDNFTSQKNCVIILTNKLSTIPSSFYINNADVSCIHIPTPTRTEREAIKDKFLEAVRDHFNTELGLLNY